MDDDALVGWLAMHWLVGNALVGWHVGLVKQPVKTPSTGRSVLPVEPTKQSSNQPINQASNQPTQIK